MFNVVHLDRRTFCWSFENILLDLFHLVNLANSCRISVELYESLTDSMPGVPAQSSYLFSGALAGFIAESTIYPLDTIRKRQMIQGQRYGSVCCTTKFENIFIKFELKINTHSLFQNFVDSCKQTASPFGAVLNLFTRMVEFALSTEDLQ